MKKMRAVVFLSLVTVCAHLGAQSAPLTKEAVEQYFSSTRSGGLWKAGRSSALIEKGKGENEYEIPNLSDDDFASAWVEGVSGSGVGEYVTVPVYFLDPLVSFEKMSPHEKIQGIIEMNNGFCRTDTLFRANNRVKKALITVYAVPVALDKTETVLNPGPIKLKEFEIQPADTSARQAFDFALELTPYQDVKGYMFFFLRMTVLDVYRGEKYDDTCISELYAEAKRAR